MPQAVWPALIAKRIVGVNDPRFAADNVATWWLVDIVVLTHAAGPEAQQAGPGRPTAGPREPWLVMAGPRKAHGSRGPRVMAGQCVDGWVFIATY